MRNLTELRFRDGTPLSEAGFAETERLIGHTLPQGFRKFVLQFDGASPEIGCFDFDGQTTAISEFLSCGSCMSSPNGILWMITAIRSLPVGLVPFARDAGDWLVCFDYRQSKIPAVVVFVPEDGALNQVCDTFENFIDSLYEE